MEWTKEKPTCNGHYWYHEIIDNGTRFEEVASLVWVQYSDNCDFYDDDYDDDEEFAPFMGKGWWEERRKLDECNGQWYGPLQPPTLPDDNKHRVNWLLTSAQR